MQKVTGFRVDEYELQHLRVLLLQRNITLQELLTASVRLFIQLAEGEATADRPMTAVLRRFLTAKIREVDA